MGKPGTWSVTHVFWRIYGIFRFSTTLLASQSHVHQNLAHLIRWADHILMNGEEALNKDGAHEIISALENAVKVIIYQMKRI